MRDGKGRAPGPAPRSPRARPPASTGPAAPPQLPPGNHSPAPPALTPRIPRSSGATTAGLHAAMPGRRGPAPEVAASRERRGAGDRKPSPPRARPPPAARRSRAAGLQLPADPRPGGRLLGTCCSASSRVCPAGSAPSSASLQGSFHRGALLAQPGDARGSRPSDPSCPQANAPLALGRPSPFPSPPPATWLPNWGVWVSPSRTGGPWRDLKQGSRFQICVLERSCEEEGL